MKRKWFIVLASLLLVTVLLTSLLFISCGTSTTKDKIVYRHVFFAHRAISPNPWFCV